MIMEKTLFSLFLKYLALQIEQNALHGQSSTFVCLQRLQGLQKMQRMQEMYEGDLF